jgi:uncharacterized membrane protein
VTQSTVFLLILCTAIIIAFVIAPGPFAQKLSAVAYGLDPQRPSHTYAVGGALLPLEARKMGMFGGFLLTYLLLLACGHVRSASFPRRRVLIVLTAFIASMAVDGGNATLYDLGLPHLYAPMLRLRLATGILMGVAMAGILLPAINGSLWLAIRETPVLSTTREFIGALVLAGGLFLTVDAGPGILYYPLGMLGVAGLAAELTLINLVFVLVLGRRVGSADGWRAALPLAMASFILSVCELAVMAVVRYITLGNITNGM